MEYAPDTTERAGPVGYPSARARFVVPARTPVAATRTRILNWIAFMKGASALKLPVE
jgi:hypothetical protein